MNSTSIADALSTELFKVGNNSLTLSAVLIAGIIVIVGFIVAMLVDRAIGRALVDRAEAFRALSSVRRLIRYAIDAIFVLVAVHMLGIDLSALFAGGAFLAVAVGFAMQNITQNFISGLILLVERNITIGDVIILEGRVHKVESVGIRSTIARANDGAQVIIPNSSLVQLTVENLSMSDTYKRITCTVGVSYCADMTEVREVLERIGVQRNDRKSKRQSAVLLKEFADSSVVWAVQFWTTDPLNKEVYRSEAMLAIWQSFADSHIEIAFPQLDIHFDNPADIESAHSQMPSTM